MTLLHLLKTLKFIIKELPSLTITGIYLLLYVDEYVVPRVKVLLRDLIQHQGIRPLNIQSTNGEVLKIVLLNLDGKWDKNCPAIEVFIK